MARPQEQAKKRTIQFWLFCAAAVMLIMATLLAFYVNQTGTMVRKETERSITETAELVATTITDRTNNIMQDLDLCALTCAEWDDVPKILSYLKEGHTGDQFLRLSYTDADGVCYTTDNATFNISESATFHKIMDEGALQVIDPISNLYQGEEAKVVYSVPLHRNGAISGILSASVNLEQLRNMFFVEYLNGEAFFHIVNQEGDMIVPSDNKNATKELSNIFAELDKHGTVRKEYSAEVLRSGMKQKQSGMFYFTLDGEDEKIMQYLPLGVEDWYLLSVVPVHYVQQSLGSLSILGVGVSCAVMLVCFSLFGIIFWKNEKNRKALEKIAFFDPVTEGLSRAKFEKDALDRIQQAPAGTYSLLSIDIYQFKMLNDTAGGFEGDRVLRYFHNVLQENFPVGTPLARISSDMFDVLFRTVPQSETEHLLKKIASDLNKFNDRLVNKYYIRLAAGVYPVDDTKADIITIQDRVNIARKAMKKSHSDNSMYTLSVYDDTERLRQSREKEIIDRFDQALADGEFLVYLQPKVDLETNRVCSAEALVRWKDPKHGLLPPGLFIPLFERDDTIVKLDRYMFDQVCVLLQKWLAQGRERIPISVNLSRRHLSDPAFLEYFIAVQQKYQVPPELLEFEITETVAYENKANLIEFLEKMHQAGFRCSLDDFGSGYSSLNLLYEIPVDVIKLDREFFSNMPEKVERSNQVIKSVVDMARRLDAKTVSEGVETEEQLAFLRQIHCDMVQGFVFSKPLSIADFEVFAQGMNEKATVFISPTEEKKME